MHYRFEPEIRTIPRQIKAVTQDFLNEWFGPYDYKPKTEGYNWCYRRCVKVEGYDMHCQEIALCRDGSANTDTFIVSLDKIHSKFSQLEYPAGYHNQDEFRYVRRLLVRSWTIWSL